MKKTHSFYIEEKYIEKLRKIAKEQSRSINFLLNEILEQHLRLKEK